MAPLIWYLCIVTTFFILAAVDDCRSRIIRNRWHILIFATSLTYAVLFFSWWIWLQVVLWSALYLGIGNVLEWMKAWMHGDTKLLLAVGSTVPFFGTKITVLYLCLGWLIGKFIYSVIPKNRIAELVNEDMKHYPMGLSFAIGFSIFLLVCHFFVVFG